MVDGVGFSPESIVPSQSELKGRAEKGGIALYKSNRFDVFVPQNPKIPLNEGLHVQISSEGPVILPQMSRGEAVYKGREDVVKQWDTLRPTDQEKQDRLATINAKLGGGKLTSWLEENCRGQLIDKKI